MTDPIPVTREWLNSHSTSSAWHGRFSVRMLNSYFRILWWWLKICCAIFVFALPLAPLYDHYFPWPPALEVRTNANYRGQIWISVGYGYSSSTRKVNGTLRTESAIERSYVLFPSVMTSPKIVTVFQDQEGRITVGGSALAFWFLLIVYLSCAWVAWHFLYRPWLSHRSGSSTNV